MTDPSSRLTPTQVLDKKDRLWDFEISMKDARVIDRTDFKVVYEGEIRMLNPSETFLRDLISKTGLMFAVMWVVALSTGQASNNEVDDEDEFCSGFTGDKIREAKEALWNSLADFFQDQQTGLKALISATQSANLAIAQRLEDLAPAVAERMEQEVDKLLSEIRTGQMS